jgi:molecular chaperone GrpE
MTEEQDRPVPEDGAPDGEAGQEPKRQAGEAPLSPSDRLATLEAEKNEARERMLRIAAEFENYKKRARKEQSEGESKARETVLRDMLEVADLLEKANAAVAGGADLKSVSEGVQLVLRLFANKLVRYDVKPFEAKGQPFDPRLHDAISQVPTADAPPGSVVSEVQKGYKIGDRLLRPAMVAVAVAPPSAPPRDATNGSGSDPDQS